MVTVNDWRIGESGALNRMIAAPKPLVRFQRRVSPLGSITGSAVVVQVARMANCSIISHSGPRCSIEEILINLSKNQFRSIAAGTPL